MPSGLPGLRPILLNCFDEVGDGQLLALRAGRAALELVRREHLRVREDGRRRRSRGTPARRPESARRGRPRPPRWRSGPRVSRSCRFMKASGAVRARRSTSAARRAAIIRHLRVGASLGRRRRPALRQAQQVLRDRAHVGLGELRQVLLDRAHAAARQVLVAELLAVLEREREVRDVLVLLAREEAAQARDLAFAARVRARRPCGGPGPRSSASSSACGTRRSGRARSRGRRRASRSRCPRLRD